MAAPSTDRAAATQIIRALIHEGWRPRTVDDGGDDVKVVTVTEALDAIFAVDAAHLHVEHRNGEWGWVWFVLGNDPEEVAADYTVNLSDAIDPVTDRWWS